MKKIIPALAMLLISAIVMSTASFAWFTMSQNVTASGMKITATADSTLVIAYAENGTVAANAKWALEASAGMDTARSLAPVSTGTLNSADAQKWYTAEAAAATASGAAANTYSDVTATGDQVWNNAYYVRRQFHVYDAGATAEVTDLYLTSIAIDGTNITGDNVYKALRVAVVSNGTVLYVTGDGTAEATGQAYVQTIGTEANADTKKYPLGTTAAVPGTNATCLTATSTTGNNFAFKNASGATPTSQAEAQVIDIYIWYEGTDADCFSTNLDANELDVTVKFSTIKNSAFTFTLS